jgi:hypothetical protein
MTTARSSRVLWTISLILILVAWPSNRASPEPPTEWQGPAGWWSGDSGTAGGSAVQNCDTFEITGDGHDIWDTADYSSGWFLESENRFEATFRVSRGTSRAHHLFEGG